MIQNDYLKGGKIFFASNSTGATYSNIKVTEIEAGASSFNGFDEWHGKDLKHYDLVDIEEGTNWSVYDGLITRKSLSEGVSDTMNIYDMAYLYLTEKQYTNFKMELDYKHGNTGGWLRSPVGFGAELGKHYMQADGGIICFSQPDGYVHMDGNVNANGKFFERVWWSQYDDDGNDLTKLAPYDQNVWHHLILTVQDGFATLQFDNFGYIYETELPLGYAGGYLYLCSNSVGSQFKNIVIEDLSVNVDAAAQAGWQPEDKDIEFDYSARQYEVDIADWKFNDIIFN